MIMPSQLILGCLSVEVTVLPFRGELREQALFGYYRPARLLFGPQL